MWSIPQCASIIKDDMSVLYIARSSPLALPHILLLLPSYCSLPLHCSPMCLAHILVWGCQCRMCAFIPPAPFPHFTVITIFSFPSSSSLPHALRPHFGLFPTLSTGLFIPFIFSLFSPKKPAGDMRCAQQVSVPCCVPPTPAFASPLFSVIVPSFAVPLHIHWFPVSWFVHSEHLLRSWFNGGPHQCCFHLQFLVNHSLHVIGFSCAGHCLPVCLVWMPRTYQTIFIIVS